MIHPVDDPIGQEFGANPTRDNPDPVFGNYQPDGHTGRDYKCWAGTPVRAVTSGTVLHIGWMGGTYDQNPWWIRPSFAGYCAVIDHGSFIGIYGHCQDGSARVRKGDRVSEGQVFILSGNTGGSTGDHLHFEILPDGYVLNSAFYGRINPARIFGSIQLQSATTITPITEDDELNSDQDAALGVVFHKVNQAPAAGQLASQGDINIVLSRLGRLEDALLSALGKPASEPSAILVKGDQEPTVYAWDGGTGYRALDYNEFAALMASGAELRTVEQAKISGGAK